MKKNHTITYIGIAFTALGIWYFYKARKARNKKSSPIGEGELVASIIKEETDKYDTPFNTEYRIVMPYQMVSKKAKEKAAILRAGRFAPNPQNIQEPLYI